MSIPIKDLALIVKTKQDLIDALEPFYFESPVEVVIRPIAAKRTLSQNALFHMWCNELSSYLLKHGRMWAAPEFVKDMLKHSFLGYKDTMRLDVSTNQPAKVRELIHTSDLSTGDMLHFMEQCEAYSAGIGCLLTIPEKSEYMQNKRAQNQ